MSLIKQVALEALRRLWREVDREISSKRLKMIISQSNFHLLIPTSWDHLQWMIITSKAQNQTPNNLEANSSRQFHFGKSFFFCLFMAQLWTIQSLCSNLRSSSWGNSKSNSKKESNLLNLWISLQCLKNENEILLRIDILLLLLCVWWIWLWIIGWFFNNLKLSNYWSWWD